MKGACAWLVVLILAVVATGGCDLEKGRFASCQDDKDCKSADETKPYCWNLRCVECAYDRHCGDSKICDKNSKSCASL